MTTGRTITLRLTIQDPVPDVAYSLQNKNGDVVGQVVAGSGSLSLDVPVRVAPGPRFLGEFVRSEGPIRRFVYIAIGSQAGATASFWNRRAKIDIHTLSMTLIEAALAGKVLEIVLPGRDKDGGPTCATVRPLSDWRAVE